MNTNQKMIKGNNKEIQQKDTKVEKSSSCNTLFIDVNYKENSISPSRVSKLKNLNHNQCFRIQTYKCY